MKNTADNSLSRLRSVTVLFFLLFSLPLAALLFILTRSAYKEEFVLLKNEALKTFTKFEERETQLFNRENQRRFEDYSFFNVTQNSLLSQQAALGFSSLSNLAPENGFPGALGYFQYNPDHSFQSPLLPDFSKTSQSEVSTLLGDEGDKELLKRMSVVQTLQEKTRSLIPFLRQTPTPAENPPFPSQYVNIPTQELLPYVRKQSGSFQPLGQSFDNQAGPSQGLRNQMPSQLNTLNLDGNDVRSFQTSIRPIELFPLLEGNLAFLRRTSLQGKGYLQGFVVDTENLVKSIFLDVLDRVETKRDVIIEIRGSAGIKRSFPAHAEGAYPILVLERTLPPPLQGFTLSFRAKAISLGPSGRFILSLGLSIVTVFLLGLFALYRLGLAQIALAKERGNFVSAVSHELKTPLTSIRLYAEMLDSEMIPSDQKRKEYYRYILSESERLSRLVNNVLLLSRVENRTEQLPMQEFDPALLLSRALEKLKPQLEAAGFTLRLEEASLQSSSRRVLADEDIFLQILMNFVENALKFSAQAEKKQIDLALSEGPAQTLRFSVRDYGPGVPRKELKKIFQLFYRGESEMTRSTKGTGLGLGLVAELAKQMGGSTYAELKSPGLECSLVLPLKSGHG